MSRDKGDRVGGKIYVKINRSLKPFQFDNEIEKFLLNIFRGITVDVRQKESLMEVVKLEWRHLHLVARGCRVEWYTKTTLHFGCTHMTTFKNSTIVFALVVKNNSIGKKTSFCMLKIRRLFNLFLRLVDLIMMEMN